MKNYMPLNLTSVDGPDRSLMIKMKTFNYMNYWISLPGESGTCAILVKIKNTAKESTATILPQKYHLLSLHLMLLRRISWWQSIYSKA